jgi:hypothetical protein
MEIIQYSSSTQVFISYIFYLILLKILWFSLAFKFYALKSKSIKIFLNQKNLGFFFKGLPKRRNFGPEFAEIPPDFFVIIWNISHLGIFNQKLINASVREEENSLNDIKHEFKKFDFLIFMRIRIF